MKRKISALISLITITCLLSAFSAALSAEWKSNGAVESYLINGKKVTGLMLIDGIRYRFDADGNLTGKYSGWSQSRSTGNYYYYIEGIMQTDYWYCRSNVWSYFDTDGAMATGEKTIDGYEYNFRANGTWDGILPVNIKEIHEKLLAEMPDIYGGVYIGYRNVPEIYASDVEKAKETFNRMYPFFPFFEFVQKENSFKAEKAVYDELKNFKYNYAEIKVNSYEYENTGTFFGLYGFYSYVSIQPNVRDFDYYDSYYTALNFTENAYAKHNIAMSEAWAVDKIDYGYYDGAEVPEGEIDYSYFHQFYNSYKPVEYNYIPLNDDIYEEDDIDEEPIPVRNPYTGNETSDTYRDPVSDLLYKPDICTRMFIYENSYNLYAAETVNYLNDAADYYEQKGYTVEREKSKLLLKYRSYNEDKTAVINFIKTEKSIKEFMHTYTKLSGYSNVYRLYIDNSFLSYYEDVFKSTNGKIKVYCYRNYDKAKEVVENLNSGIFELIKKY